MKHAIDVTITDNRPQTIAVPDGKFKNSDKIIQDFLKVKLPSNWKKLNSKAKRKFIKQWTYQGFPHLPESLLSITVGSTIDGDSGISVDEIPEWLDRKKFLRGQKFAQDNLMGVMATALLTLFGIYSFEDAFKPMIASGRSSEPYTAFKRYLETVANFRSWYTSDPWTKDTQAYNNIKTVREMHVMIRNKLHAMSDEAVDKATTIKNSWSPMRDILLEDFRSACPVALPGQCPFSTEALGPVRLKKLNQGEMALTQGSFVCLVVTFPTAFGIHDATDENLDDFCYVWKGIGYLLGIDDAFSFCNGSLEDIKKRSEDYLNEWVKPNLRDISPEWEHMIRCLFDGIQYYIPVISYEMSLLYVMELMNIDMPRLRSTLSYGDWIRFYSLKFTLKYACRFKVIRKLLNKFFNNCVNDAVNFTKEQHEQLRMKSSKKLSFLLKNNY